MNSLGEKIIDAIISGGLCHAQCAHDKDHPCIVVWSSGAVEQIDAIIQALALSAPNTADDARRGGSA